MEIYGLACGYAVPMAPRHATPGVEGHGDAADFGEILDGVLQNAIALLCVLAAFAVSLAALAFVVR